MFNVGCALLDIISVFTHEAGATHQSSRKLRSNFFTLVTLTVYKKLPVTSYTDKSIMDVAHTKMSL